MSDTIFALSSGGLPSGVAVIRISGPNSRIVIETMCPAFEFGRSSGLSPIYFSNSTNVIDKGLVLSFVGPASFTGEDVVEFQVHGGKGVVDSILSSLSTLQDFRHADAGEFTYRAFENGKLDLTQAEGIADLIASETESQRKLAYDQSAGKARAKIEDWLSRLVKMRAFIEAEIDFVEEDDIPGSVSEQVWVDVDRMISEISSGLDSINAGEIIRDGFKVALMGKPNSGKSTLLNSLAGRDVAIVSDQPGTTRDIIEVRLNLGGQIVVVSDTAGIHDTDDAIEKEGIRRALEAAEHTNFGVWLHAAGDKEAINAPKADLVVFTKSDLGAPILQGNAEEHLKISAKTNTGIDALIEIIAEKASAGFANNGEILFSRERQKSGLLHALNALGLAKSGIDDPLEIRAENMRIASDALGKIVGRVDVEDILGAIFSEFCVGK